MAVDGSLRYSSWERDGQRRSKLEVAVRDVEFTSRQQQAQQPAPQQAPAQQAPAADVYDEEIPF